MSNKVIAMSYGYGSSNGNPFPRPGSVPQESKEERKRRRENNRRMFKNRLRNEWNMNEPVVTRFLVTICVAMWIVQIFLQFFPHIYTRFMVFTGIYPVVGRYLPWTLVTHIFFHAGFLHILMNMLVLWSVGSILEKMLGHWPFLGLFLASGIAGGIFYELYWVLFAQNQSQSIMYGASGAIFGLFAALLIAQRKVGTQQRTSVIIFLVILFIMPAIFTNIAWQAHVGGFLAGGLISWLMMQGIPQLRGKSIGFRMALYDSIVTIVLLAVWIAVMWTQAPAVSLLSVLG